MKKISLLALLLLSTAVFATPENDVIVTIGYGAGGTNTIIRTFAADADNIGALKFIPEERPGANGSIALKNYFNNTPTNKSILGVSGGIQNADLGGYTTIDANIMRTFSFSGSRLTATLYGRNLGDVHYSTRYVTGYYPDRGRTIGAEISMAF